MARALVLTRADMRGTGEPDGLWQPDARKESNYLIDFHTLSR